MKIYDKYILILASLLLATTVIVAAIGEVRLDLYFSIYVIEALVLTELYVYLNPKAKRELNKVNYALFAGFLVIVAAKVAEILWGIKLL
jgi:hypothetical protein